MKTLEELKQEMDTAWADWWDAAVDVRDVTAWAAARDAYRKKLKELADEDT